MQFLYNFTVVLMSNVLASPFSCNSILLTIFFLICKLVLVHSIYFSVELDNAYN
jgi:hypothetical protein